MAPATVFSATAVAAAALTAVQAAEAAQAPQRQATATTASAAASRPGGAITRNEAISRAHYWYKNRGKIVYSWYGTYPDPTGRRYRRDCSGYVSMALHLKSSLSTVTLPGQGKRISKGSMQAGDYIGKLGGGTGGAGGHVRLFHKWSKKGRTYWAYDFGSTPVKHRIYSVEGHHKAYRYKNIRNSKPKPPKPDTRNRPIRRDDVVKRAKSWVDRKVRYSMTKTLKDSDGHAFRNDGSGFVSMAWHVRDGKNKTGFTTDTVLGRFAVKTKRSDLKPGDAFVNTKPGTKGHIMIFLKWRDGGKRFEAFALNRKVGYAKFRVLSTSSLAKGGFIPVRYKQIRD